jgi:hypothetical protein
MDQKKHRYISVMGTIIVLILSIALTLAASAAIIKNETKIYEGQNGWAIWANFSDSHVGSTMKVTDGKNSTSNVSFIKIVHVSQKDPQRFPEVAIIYASGYIKLKQNADPNLTIPFGGSFVLGPAYNGSNSTSDKYLYNNSPMINHLEIDTSLLPELPLKLKATGTNRDFNVTYDIVMPKPTDLLTKLHVNQTYKATDNITISKTARQKHEGFKLVQFSSMFINENASCDRGNKDCHDNNAARYAGNNLVEKAFRDLILSSFIFGNPQNLSRPWLDLLHTDNDSWHNNKVNVSGNTPNLRIVIDNVSEESILVPQGWINKTTNPNDDNVGLWIHDDGNASVSWKKGQEGHIGYCLLAQDNPPGIDTDRCLP